MGWILGILMRPLPSLPTWRTSPQKVCLLPG